MHVCFLLLYQRCSPNLQPQVMQPPSILRTDNQPANLSDLLGLPTAPYFDFSYLLCILINYSFDLCNYQLLYFLIVKDYKQASYVKVKSVFDVNIIHFQTQTETCFSSFSVIPALILNFNAILVQVLNQLILISIIKFCCHSSHFTSTES